MTWLRRAMLLALLSLASGWAASQSAGNEPPAVVYSQDELDQLMAPVALYPDTLLMQVLVAATYPLELVAAERFIRGNPKLSGEALTRAAASKGWDASVVSLLQFPSVVTMMNDKLDWTQQLGDAFLAQQAEVMDTVQRLRARAHQTGSLQSTSQQTVVVQEKVIVIEPARPQVVYVPYYNPLVVYGPWWVPARPPWYWVPPPIYRPPGFGQVVAAGIFWGVAITIRDDIWNDYRPSWRDRQINIHNHVTIINVNRRPPPGGQWRHDPMHRKGVAYRDNIVRERVTAGTVYRPLPRPGVVERVPSRGDDDKLRPRPQSLPAERPGKQPDVRYAPRNVTAPTDRRSPISPGEPRDVVKAHTERGRSSREAAARAEQLSKPAHGGKASLVRRGETPHAR